VIWQIERRMVNFDCYPDRTENRPVRLGSQACPLHQVEPSGRKPDRLSRTAWICSFAKQRGARADHLGTLLFKKRQHWKLGQSKNQIRTNPSELGHHPRDGAGPY
jgi:hypothetical protein